MVYIRLEVPWVEDQNQSIMHAGRVQICTKFDFDSKHDLQQWQHSRSAMDINLERRDSVQVCLALCGVVESISQGERAVCSRITV